MIAENDVVARFFLDGRLLYSRWHLDATAEDAVVVHPSGTWVFTSLQALGSAWSDWQPPGDDMASPVIDVDAVRAWLNGQSLAVPHAALLGAWNLAGDVARGLGLPWTDRGRCRDGAYDKLWAASVAAPLGHPAWTPRWSPLEHRTLVAMGQNALRVVRAAVYVQRS